MDSVPQSVFDAALAAAVTRKRVDDLGERWLAAARTQAARAGRLAMAENLKLETGVRPGGKSKHGERRPYARVTCDLTPEQIAADDRTATATMRQILRKAMPRG